MMYAMSMTEHCANFDPSYEGCRECVGLVRITQQDGSEDIVCRAGELFLKRLKETCGYSTEVSTVACQATDTGANPVIRSTGV